MRAECMMAQRHCAATACRFSGDGCPHIFPSHGVACFFCAHSLPRERQLSPGSALLFAAAEDDRYCTKMRRCCCQRYSIYICRRCCCRYMVVFHSAPPRPRIRLPPCCHYHSSSPSYHMHVFIHLIQAVWRGVFRARAICAPHISAAAESGGARKMLVLPYAKDAVNMRGAALRARRRKALLKARARALYA